MSDFDSGNDPLFGGGAQSFQFNNFNDVVQGTILKMEERQQADFDGKPLTWADGKPRNILVITLQTDERDNDADDGVRAIWAKGGRYEIAKGEGSSMKEAILQAAREKGITKSEQMYGGLLGVAYTGESKPTQKGFNPAKLFVASFKRAAPKAVDLFGDESPPPAAVRSADPF